MTAMQCFECYVLPEVPALFLVLHSLWTSPQSPEIANKSLVINSVGMHLILNKNVYIYNKLYV